MPDLTDQQRPTEPLPPDALDAIARLERALTAPTPPVGQSAGAR